MTTTDASGQLKVEPIRGSSTSECKAISEPLPLHAKLRLKLRAARDVVTGRRKLSFVEVAVPLVFTFYVVMRSIDRVFSTRIAKILANPVYQTVYSNIIFPLGLAIAQLVCNILYILVQRFYFKRKEYGLGFLSPVSELASTKGRYPQYLLFLFITGDAISNLLMGWGTPFLSQTMQNILLQFTLLFLVLFSYIFLNTRYDVLHYISCILVVCSGLQSITVELQTGNPPLGEYRAANGQYYTTSAIYFFLFFLSTIPAAGSNVFKQWCLQGSGSAAKRGELDVMYAAFWSGIWQLVFSLALLPTMWIPFPGIETVKPDQTGQAIASTFACFFGYAPSDIPADSVQAQLCTLPDGTAFKWFLLYSLFNLSFNCTMLWLTKYLSTTWVQVANVMVTLLSSFLGMSPLLMGDSAVDISLQEYLGLFLGIIALVLYNLKPEINKNGEDVYLIRRRKAELETEDSGEKMAIVDPEVPDETVLKVERGDMMAV